MNKSTNVESINKQANKVRMILILPVLILTLALSGCFNNHRTKIKKSRANKAETSQQVEHKKGY